MIIKYTWEENDGIDLDTATRIGYKLYNNDDVTYENYVGFDQPGNNENIFIQYGGDNRESGNETTAIKFKDYINNISEEQLKQIYCI